MAVPELTSSSESAPFTMKALANSRCPFTEIVPGFSTPEGSSVVAPTSCTVAEVMDVIGATPACRESRSV